MRKVGKKYVVLAIIFALLLSVVGSIGGGKNVKATSLKDGTYTSIQAGHNGPVEYSITIEGGEIANIEVLDSKETVGVSDKALLTDLPEKIIESQSIGVDNIAGATLSSLATKRAVADAIEQAGGDPADYEIEEEKASPAEVEDSADIVIIGGGGAGLSAATTALEQGASVIIIEKMGYVGGNTMISGGIYNAPDEELQSKAEMTQGLEQMWLDLIEEEPVNDAHQELQEILKQQYDEWKESGSTAVLDSAEFFALQTWAGGDKVADLELVKELTFNAYDDLMWIRDLGWEYNDVITTGSGSLYPRTHTSVRPLGVGYIDAYMSKIADDENCQIYYNTRATDLVQDDTGRVVAVEAEDLDGNTFTFTAEKGVLLATGGFAGNAELVQKFNTTGKWPDLSQRKSSNLPAMEGDGIVMAEAVGAQLVDMDQIQLLFIAEPNTGQVTLANIKPNGMAGLLFINQEGNRFVREDGRRDEISLGIIEQTDEIMYMVQSAGSSGITSETNDLNGVNIEYLIEAGYVFYGDTLKEAAEQVNIPYEQLQKTIDDFNQMVDDQVTEDEFGRKQFTYKFEGEGWYIIPRSVAIHHTMGGVKIDTDTHVLDAEDQIIPGLYAAGEVVGGIHGANRIGGNALVETVVFGKKAANTILADSP
jgi:urocanate reductase